MFATTNLRRPALTLIVALSLVALTTLGAQEIGPASAGAPLLVTKTADTNDGTCDADCSLREAIVAANAAGGADTITLPAGTYTLVIAGMGEDASATGDLDITDQLIIAARLPSRRSSRAACWRPPALQERARSTAYSTCCRESASNSVT